MKWMYWESAHSCTPAVTKCYCPEKIIVLICVYFKKPVPILYSISSRILFHYFGTWLFFSLIEEEFYHIRYYQYLIIFLALQGLLGFTRHKRLAHFWRKQIIIDSEWRDDCIIVSFLSMTSVWSNKYAENFNFGIFSGSRI